MLDVIIELLFISIIIFAIYHFVSTPKRERNKQNKINKQYNQKSGGQSIELDNEFVDKNEI